jgi:hypothetical protein
MEKYIKTALRATGEAWAVLKTSATTGQNPKLAFEQLRDKYKGSNVEDYVNDYTKICEEELPRIRDADTYLSDAKDVGNKVFKVFQDSAKKVFAEEMTDGDWNRIIKMASDIGYDKWDSSVKEYAKRYSALIVWELDRQYQRLHHIKKDWWNYV